MPGHRRAVWAKVVLREPSGSGNSITARPHLRGPHGVKSWRYRKANRPSRRISGAVSVTASVVVTGPFHFDPAKVKVDKIRFKRANPKQCNVRLPHELARQIRQACGLCLRIT